MLTNLIRHLRSPWFHIATGFGFMISGLLVILVGEFFVALPFDRFWSSPSTRSLILSLSLISFGGGLLMLQYLRGGFLASRETAHTPDLPDSVSVAALREKVRALFDEVASLKTAQLDALGGSRQDLIKALSSTVHSGVADELEARFRQRLSQSTRDQEIRESFANAEHRLRAELVALGRRSNLNLVIGILTTSMAVGLLTYMVLGAATNFDNLTSLLSHYIPRLGLVLFIEVFSFFFLKLYKTTLAEVRTYQDDLTTLTVQYIAAVAGLSTGDPTGAASLSKELLASKRSKREPPTPKAHDVDPKVLAELAKSLAKVLPTKAKDA